MTAPVPPVDLDRLEGRLRNAAMGSLRVGEHYGIHLYAGESPVGMTLRAADAAAIVAAVNAAPALIARVRAQDAELRDLRAKVAAVEALTDRHDQGRFRLGIPISEIRDALGSGS